MRFLLRLLQRQAVVLKTVKIARGWDCSIFGLDGADGKDENGSFKWNLRLVGAVESETSTPSTLLALLSYIPLNSTNQTKSRRGIRGQSWTRLFFPLLSFFLCKISFLFLSPSIVNLVACPKCLVVMLLDISDPRIFQNILNRMR